MKTHHQTAKVKKIIGMNIYRLRRRRNMSLQSLSDKTEIGFKKLDAYEIGKGNMHLDTLARVSMALNVDLSELISFQDHEI